MTSRPNSSQSEGSCVVECTVPTPFFSGRDQSHVPSAISFAPATIEFATPVTHGTLISEFETNPQVLRDGGDMFSAEDFAELVITWPDLGGEWKAPMSDIVKDRDRVSRKELAQFVVEQFNSLVRVINARSSSNSSEWRLGDTFNAYSARNTCLVFLFTPAPRVWQPAFRVRNFVSHIAPKLSPSDTPSKVVLQ